MDGEVAKEVGRRLGQATPVKRWLVRLLVRRLELLADQHEALGRLVTPPSESKRGAKPLTLR